MPGLLWKGEEDALFGVGREKGEAFPSARSHQITAAFGTSSTSEQGEGDSEEEEIGKASVAYHFFNKLIECLLSCSRGFDAARASCKNQMAHCLLHSISRGGQNFSNPSLIVLFAWAVFLDSRRFGASRRGQSNALGAGS